MMNTDELLKLKKLLDEGIISQEEFDKQKEQQLSGNTKKKGHKEAGLVIGIACVFMLCVCIITSNFDNKTSRQEQTVRTEEKVPSEFAEELPISVTGKMYDNIINMPELSVSITNNTTKDISAIKFYFLPVDVYGEAVTGIFTTNELYTDDTISAGTTISKAWQMLDSSMKAGNVYVYSVFFADGTEWGDREAAISDIKKYGYKFEVKY